VLVKPHIIQYRQTNDEKYLAYFLHSYEPKLDHRTAKFCRVYKQEHNFADIKQAIVEALVLKLPDYNPDLDIDFLFFTRRYVADAVHDYIRQCGSVFSVRPSEYRTLRKVAAIFYTNRDKPLSERIQEIDAQTGMSDEKIHNYIYMAEEFRFPVSLDEPFESEDRDAISVTEKLHDTYPSPESIVIRCELYEAIIDEIEKLRFRDSKLLLDYLGIDCLYCGRVSEPKPIADIADEHQLRDEQSVTNRFRGICGRLRVELEKLGWKG